MVSLELGAINDIYMADPYRFYTFALLQAPTRMRNTAWLRLPVAHPYNV